MKIEQAITILKKYIKWRRGEDVPMINPKVLEEAIDRIVLESEIIDKTCERICNNVPIIYSGFIEEKIRISYRNSQEL